MTERRFNEAEVAAIFERATKSPQPGHTPVASGEGMTLAQLEEIGRDVGIAPETIRDAATVVGASGVTMSRKVLGLPLAVGRTVELNRKITDDEWERFVVDLRETFDARGTVRSEGSLRQWTNGNLHALLEPSGNGHRVRLRTMKGQSLNLMIAGGLSFAMSGVALAVGLGSSGGVAAQLASVGGIAAVGVAMIAYGAAMLPGWARLRRRQMEDIAARLVAATSSPSKD